MLGYLADRPLTLQRFPKGIASKGFMQKNAAAHFPESIGRHVVPTRDGGETTYAVVAHADDLAYLANQGTITFHMWTSSVARPDRPSWMIMDLDPEEGDVDKVRRAAFVVRDVLAGFELEAFVVATGSKGFHLWVPLDGTHTFEAVATAARAIAGLAVLEDPDTMTTEFLKKNRGGRVFLDWLRNGPIATVVVPFSLRPRPTAPVAVPIRWTELAAASPDQWTLDALGDRLDVVPDVAPQSLPIEGIVSAARAAAIDFESPHDRFGRER